ncbi:BTAD domain-containing putative transcriptional regulator [Nonomuraea sp. NPDC005692]|uniref:AfsR/SARP family transcriptional regulator n=1 Tax=Nonomuraea sp. NPDC005692 TaxID=3157168 RepID=UPI0033F25E21
MRFEILGPTSVLDEDGAPVALGGPRVRALLTLLALNAGRVVDAGRLVDDLYGPHPPDGVANALQSQVSRLRRALGRDLVEFHPAGYRLVADPHDVDARRFELLALDGRRALVAGDAGRAAALLGEALELWRGAPLADAPHAVSAAAGLEELRLAAVEDRLQADLELGRHRDLVAELRRLTAAHPLRERLRAQLMRALYGSGRQAEALAVYDEARRLLDRELGIEPGAELAAVHLAVLRADPSLTPPITVPTAVPTAVPSPAPSPAPTSTPTSAPASAPVQPRGTQSLPEPVGPAVSPGGGLKQGLRAQLTSFVGRAEELAQVGARLRDSRLVTLIGPGGAGKTRLAQEAAAQEPGDVCFVPLAHVAGAAGVPGAVLVALDIRDALLPAPQRAAVGPVTRLLTALAERDLLLVLDNCEHLVGAVAELADALLASCPGLRVLTTSREALGITGESILPVSPLRLPPPEPDDPLEYAAVRLFADRAAAVRPGFAVDADHAADVVRICRALDGLPLAIELAAARLRTLSVADVAARLDDRFRLLTRGSRTALPRHQTLRAVVAWSWDLLDDAEQRLAARLSVFVGGATPEAAERVCGLPEEVLFSLAEKSLVEYVGGRYRMLDTIRAFCAERLAESGETAAIRDAHTAYYLDLVLTADPLLRTADQLTWLARLDQESDDLEAAVRWTTASGQPETGLRLLAHSACYWWMRGHRGVIAGLAAALLARIGDAGPAGMEEEYVMCLLVTAWTGVADDVVRERLAEVHELLPITHLPERVEFLMMMRSMFTGPPGDVEEIYHELQAHTEGLPPWQRALSYSGAGFVLQILGRIEESLASFRHALAAFRAIGERWGAVLVLSGLGELASREGDYAASYALSDEGLTLARELGARAEMAEALCRRGDALLGMGEPLGGRADFEEAAELARRVGSMDMLAWAHLGMAEVALVGGERDAALSLLAQARAECPDDWFSTEDIRNRIDEALGRAVSER